MTDYANLTRLLGGKFIQRKDAKSLQNDKGEWHPAKCRACADAKITCTHRPMSMEDFTNHFTGRATLGHYLVSPVDQTCKLFAFDLDLRKPDPKSGYHPVDADGNPYNPREEWLKDESPLRTGLTEELRTLADGLAWRVHNLLGIPVALADSGGKGLHVYCFTGVVPAEAAKELATSILRDWCFTAVRGENFWRHSDSEMFQNVEIEVFPKQATVNPDGLGNLMKLPLGLHRKTGRWSAFLTTEAPLTQLAYKDPTRVLEGDLPWE